MLIVQRPTITAFLCRNTKTLKNSGVFDPARELQIMGSTFFPLTYRRKIMFTRVADRAGKVKYGILAWLIGLPLPIVLILLFYRGCDF